MSLLSLLFSWQTLITESQSYIGGTAHIYIFIEILVLSSLTCEPALPCTAHDCSPWLGVWAEYVPLINISFPLSVCHNKGLFVPFVVAYVFLVLSFFFFFLPQLTLFLRSQSDISYVKSLLLSLLPITTTSVSMLKGPLHLIPFLIRMASS